MVIVLPSIALTSAFKIRQAKQEPFSIARPPQKMTPFLFPASTFLKYNLFRQLESF